MFEYLKKFEHIFVIGPGRSGTRFIATCIAQDTGYFYIDEKRYACDSLQHLCSKRKIWLRKNKPNHVIHGPRISRWAHTLAGPNDGVVFCWRNIPDVLASQEKQGTLIELSDLAKFDLREGRSAQVIQDFWEDVQLAALGDRAIEVRFPEDVKRDPRFVPKNERVNWAWNQTEKKR